MVVICLHSLVNQLTDKFYNLVLISSLVYPTFTKDFDELLTASVTMYVTSYISFMSVPYRCIACAVRKRTVQKGNIT